MNPVVSIMMGSDSDLPIMSKCAEFLELLEIPYEITIISAHRTPDRFLEYMSSVYERGIKVIVAGAGGAAHLPGMAAAVTPLPVIGVPILSKALGGADSLYSIVQMPPGIPVATVSINGAENAGILAAKILGLENSAIMDKVKAYSQSLKETVLKKSEKLEAVGYKEYLREKNSLLIGG